MKYQEIENHQDLVSLLNQGKNIAYKAFQNLDFTKIDKDGLLQHQFSNCLFLGCSLPDFMLSLLKDSFIFPKLEMPYNCYINHLYTKDDLYKAYIAGRPETFADTYDQKVYRHYLQTGKHSLDIKETLARRLHDHAITDALDDFLTQYDEKKIVAFMGGHTLPRNDKSYRQVAEISKQLTEQGYLMTSGGGPGAMEATHLGAWFAGKSDKDLQKAIAILSEAPDYKHPLWLDKAFEIIELYPTSQYESLGIPTWLYGHEPATPFASRIAKYFDNSIREDGLLTIAKGGIIFAPGSAGTMQEIFQEATQNHYLTHSFASPMIFMNKDYWTKEMPVYKFLEDLLRNGKYKNLILSLSDDSNEIIKNIKQFTKIPSTK